MHLIYVSCIISLFIDNAPQFLFLSAAWKGRSFIFPKDPSTHWIFPNFLTNPIRNIFSSLKSKI